MEGTFRESDDPYPQLNYDSEPSYDYMTDSFAKCYGVAGAVGIPIENPRCSVSCTQSPSPYECSKQLAKDNEPGRRTPVHDESEHGSHSSETHNKLRSGKKRTNPSQRRITSFLSSCDDFIPQYSYTFDAISDSVFEEISDLVPDYAYWPDLPTPEVISVPSRTTDPNFDFYRWDENGFHANEDSDEDDLFSRVNKPDFPSTLEECSFLNSKNAVLRTDKGSDFIPEWSSKNVPEFSIKPSTVISLEAKLANLVKKEDSEDKFDLFEESEIHTCATPESILCRSLKQRLENSNNVSLKRYTHPIPDFLDVPASYSINRPESKRRERIPRPQITKLYVPAGLGLSTAMNTISGIGPTTHSGIQVSTHEESMQRGFVPIIPSFSRFASNCLVRRTMDIPHVVRLYRKMLHCNHRIFVRDDQFLIHALFQLNPISRGLACTSFPFRQKRCP